MANRHNNKQMAINQQIVNLYMILFKFKKRMKAMLDIQTYMQFCNPVLKRRFLLVAKNMTTLI